MIQCIEPNCDEQAFYGRFKSPLWCLKHKKYSTYINNNLCVIKHCRYTALYNFRPLQAQYCNTHKIYNMTITKQTPKITLKLKKHNTMYHVIKKAEIELNDIVK